MIELFPDFIKNLSVLVMLAVGFVYVQPLSENLQQRTVRSLFLGVLFGIVIVVIMLDPITLPMGATFDARAGPARSIRGCAVPSRWVCPSSAA